MSGICGIVNLDGAPVDGRALKDLTAFLAFRGPDAQELWSGDGAGLGHAMLRTTFESEHEHQPFSLDGDLWITADARIDGRGELKRKLAAKDGAVHAPATDAELILRAYRAWGEGCVEHLLGDFAFAIWDRPARRLFCARDHFGVKPFYYARIGRSLIFSNTLDCVRRHPAVCDALDDLAIADFLLFDMNQDPAGTVFAAIHRLPPAQCLSWSEAGLKLHRYWTLPAGAEVRYRRGRDYVERFRELLDEAVGDRLRTRQVAVSMSGGLDSSSIAVIAKAQLSRESAPFDLHAFTVVYDRLVHDEERRYATIVGRELGIPIHYCVADPYTLYEHFHASGMRFPEPFHEPEGAAAWEALKAQSTRSRVVLTGWDGDALLNESPKPYLRTLLNDRKLGRWLAGMIRYAVSQRRILPLAWRDRFARRDRGRNGLSYPVWLDPALEGRYALPERWKQVHAERRATHPIRPYAYGIYDYLTRMSNFFDRYDAGVTRLLLEFRHPLIDLRMLDFCLTLPPLPWCVKKEILRSSMQGRLPEAVRRRPKTPLGGHPGLKMLLRDDARWVDRFVATPTLNSYVDRAKIPRIWGGDDPEETWKNLRPLSLNFWLRGLQPSSQPARGDHHESH